MKRMLLIFMTLALAACSLVMPPAPTPDYASAVITLERTACFGTCPIYKLTIHGGGRLEYVGQQYVAVTGQESAVLTPQQVQALIAAFQQADYFNLKDNYTAPVTDLPSTITSLTLAGQSKTVNNYGGCAIDFAGKAPQALCDLEQKIDSITNSKQWVGK